MNSRSGFRSEQSRRPLWSAVQLTPATVVYFVLFLIPLGFLVAYSFYSVDGFQFVPTWTFDNYIQAITSEVYRSYFIRTFITAAITATIVLAVAFPFCYVIVFVLRAHRQNVYFLVLVALFGGYLVRIYAWRTILGANGLINDTLFGLGITDAPVSWLSNSQFAIILALANYLVPLGVLPIYAAMQSVSPHLIEAARDLGSSHARTSLTVVLPLVAKGCGAAFTFAFIGTAADWVSPQLLGGTGDQLIGNQIAFQFGGGFNWPMGATLAVCLVLCVALLLGAASLVLRRWLR